MPDVPRIEGTPDPRRTANANSDDEIDPEKFKKIMKVDESDESQKRNKKNKAEEDEDVDEEDETNESKSAAPGFSALMDDSETRDSLFNSQGAPQVGSSDDDAPTGPPGPSPFSMMSNRQDGSPQVPNSPSGLLLSPSSNAPTIDSSSDKQESTSDQRSQVKKMQKNAKKQLTKAIKIAKEAPPKLAEKTKKEKEVTAKAPMDMTKQKDDSEVIKPSKEKVAPADVPVKSEQEREKKVSETASLFEPEKKRSETNAPATDLELIDLDKKRQKQLESQLKTGKDESDKDKDEKDEDQLQLAQDLEAPPIDGTQAAQVEAPSYSKLSSKVYDLYERLVGLITVQQFSGLSKTTVKLHMPGSVFNKAEIIIQKSSSSPTLNVQLFGSPQAVETFNANMADLVAAFQDNKRAVEVNISRPYLLKEYRHSVKKVAGSSEGDKQGGQSEHEDQEAS